MKSRSQLVVEEAKSALPDRVSDGVFTAQRSGDVIEFGLPTSNTCLLRVQLSGDNLRLLLDSESLPSLEPSEMLSPVDSGEDLELALLERLSSCVVSIFDLWGQSDQKERENLVRRLQEWLFARTVQRLTPEHQEDIKAVIDSMGKREWGSWVKSFVLHLDHLPAYGASVAAIQNLKEHLEHCGRYGYWRAPDTDVFRSDNGQLLSFADWARKCRKENAPSPIRHRLPTTEWQDLLLAAEKYLETGIFGTDAVA